MNTPTLAECVVAFFEWMRSLLLKDKTLYCVAWETFDKRGLTKKITLTYVHADDSQGQGREIARKQFCDSNTIGWWRNHRIIDVAPAVFYFEERDGTISV